MVSIVSPTTGDAYAGFGLSSTTANDKAIILPFAGTASALRCVMPGGPEAGAGTQTLTVLVMVADVADPNTWAATTMTCAMDEATGSCSDLAHSFALDAGDSVNFKLSASGTTPIAGTRMTCAFKVVP